MVRRLGGTGSVEEWEGHDDILDRDVTITVVAGADVSQLTEAMAAARLAHRGIVPTFDVGWEEGRAFVVHERPPGETLRGYVRRCGLLSVPAAVHVATDVAEALAHAHRAGLAHGHLCLDTIRLGPGGVVKLAELGVARLSAAATPEDDVRALGAVLYELVCGQPPMGPDVVPPRRRRAAVPRPLEELTMQALRGDTDAPTVAQGLAAIDLGDDAVPDVVWERTPPAGTRPVPRRPATRRGPLLGVGVLAAGALAVAVSLTGDGGDGAGRPGAGRSGRQVAVAEVRSFDPFGDGDENEERAGLVADGSPTTVWRTHRYARAGFGNLKPGVGLVLQLDGGRSVRQVTVRTPSVNWAGAVYFASVAGPRLEDWGQAVATANGLDGDRVFETEDRPARFVLVWFTDPGTDHQLEVSEIIVEGSS